MKNLLLGSMLILLFSCNGIKEEQHIPITNEKDYVGLLTDISVKRTKAIAKVDSQIAFWDKKLETQPNGFIYMQKIAVLYQNRFELFGDINDLKKAHHYLKEINKWVSGKRKQQNMFALASHAITLHKFNLSKQYGETALEMDRTKDKAWYLLFDAYMELGEYRKAAEIINYAGKLDDFDYLVRASKYMDFIGDTDSSFVLMQDAEVLLEKYNATSLLPWIKTYLGDMYGHSGNLEKSYQYYLKALALDPNADHALLGIAKIAYSNDKNITAAKKILSALSETKTDPGILWLQAKIATYEGNLNEAKKYYDNFKSMAKGKGYEGMYNRYLAIAEAEFYKNYEASINLAKNEIQERPTLESYDLLAWVYYQKGDYQRALNIVNLHLKDQSSEPLILYHSGMIFHANKDYDLAKTYLKEAYEGSFELGPIISRRIKDVFHYM